jgi:COP9 signalosome complex subunit 1
LKAAVAEAKAGKDVERYRDAVEALRRVSLSDPETEFDRAWIEKTSAANKKETQHLESQLKVYRSNLVKESVRVSYFVHRVTAINYMGRKQGGILTVMLFF